jgi:SAM-dependent methyltransferase
MTGAPILFDLDLLHRHRQRAQRMAVPGADFLLARAVTDLVERIATVKRRFEHAADIGSLTTDLADQLLASGQVGFVTRIGRFDAGSAHAHAESDGETVPLAPGSIDLAVSALSLQWVNDLPGLLAQIRQALRPDGLFLAVLVGGDTLSELRNVLTQAESDVRGGAAPRVAPFADVRDIGGLLQRAGFTLPVTDTDRLTVRYDSMFHLTRDLRAMGATSPLAARDPRPLTREIAGRAAALYAERFSDPDGRIRATFELISLSGWSPHESQPKPLKPGSARQHLAAAIEAAKKEDLS